MPTLVARNWNAPVRLVVAPYTGEPTVFSTGILSPVSMDSSMVEYPRTTSPSTGTFSPGRMAITSPDAIMSTGRSTSWPSRTTLAVLGLSSMRRRMASEVRPLARASRNRPRSMRAMMIAEVSKYTEPPIPLADRVSGEKVRMSTTATL